MYPIDFQWQIPLHYNIGVDVCDRWANILPDKPAILWQKETGEIETLSYGYLKAQSNRLANVLRGNGVKKGDRVALILAQGAAAVIAHIAIYKLGAIAVPLATLFGADAMQYRLQNAGAKIIICNQSSFEKIEGFRQTLPELTHIMRVEHDFYEKLAQASDQFIPLNTLAEDPALMIYTSGTTGQPKGALHAHRVLLGHLPGVIMPHEGFPQPDDLMWTPADWAWAGGLLNILLPALHFGVPVVAKKFEKFDPDEAFALMSKFKVKNTFIPPTALRMLRAVENPRATYDLHLRTIGSGGESLGAATFEWGKEALGLNINEFYGQTECNLVLSSAASWGISKAGAIGKAVAGHRVAIIDEKGQELPPNTQGQIAIHAPDPVMFLNYWQNEAATKAKFIGNWLTTGDQGVQDDEGYISFFGRDDDVITSSGYRIGPSEIEDCLIKHEAVALAAVVGKPDALRTEIVKAFVVLKPHFHPSPELAKAIQHFVRERVSAHSYPREVEFIAQIPMTTTGKVIRRLLRDK
jgi:acetyl-CoA synthetase